MIVSGVTLPGIESAIGPFAIFTRKAAGGQIADMTRAFGSIYVTQDIGVSTLTVSLVKGTTVEVSTTTELYFDFVLTWDIWVGDIFVV